VAQRPGFDLFEIHATLCDAARRKRKSPLLDAIRRGSRDGSQREGARGDGRAAAVAENEVVVGG
jgi:hypothetical protein